MFDKEKYKREVFKKYHEQVNKKKVFKRQVKSFLVAAVGFVAIGVTATLAYNRASVYEKNIDKSNTLSPGKTYDGGQTANLTPENKIDQPSKDENEVTNIVEETKEEVKYEPTSEFLKRIELIDLTSNYTGLNEENHETFLTEDSIYETSNDLIDEGEITRDYYIVGVQNGNLVITIIGSEKMKLYHKYVEMNIEYDKNYIIDNVDAKDVHTIFYATYGQDFCGDGIVYLILNDGTVKGIDVTDGYRRGSFIADNIVGLENVERLENSDIHDIIGGGAVTVLAFTKDNKTYEISPLQYYLWESDNVN